MSEPPTAYAAPTVTLSDGRTLTLREPRATDLRGVKLLDLLQLEPAAAAPLVERVRRAGAPFAASDQAETLSPAQGCHAIEPLRVTRRHHQQQFRPARAQ